MVRQLHMEMDDEVFENTHPGCIRGIFHALNYNYWQKNVKKIIPNNKKHLLPKYSKGTGRTRTRLIAYDSDEMDDLLDVKTSRVPASSNTKNTNSTSKRSLRTRIKTLISEEPRKKKTYKPRFQRTYSIHHLECSDYVLPKITPSDNKANGLKNQEFYDKFKNNRKNHVSEKYEGEEETNVDVLEIYKVNKDLFSKVRKYSDGEARAKFTRSGSYPFPKISQIKSFKSCKLDHKQSEIWSQSKIDKLFANTRPKSVEGTVKYSRRTLSLNESSLETYAQLLSKSSIEEPKFSSSKSLRLTNERSFKKIRSISHVDYYGIFENEPSRDGHSLVSVVKGDLGSNRNTENDRRNVEVAEVDKINEEIEEQKIVIKDSKKEEETEITEISEEKLPFPSSFFTVQSDLEEDSTSLANSLASKDFKCEKSPLLESEFFSSKRFDDIEDKNDSLTRSYNDFNFVSDILDRSGFSKNDFFAPWYSLDQPLNPSVFNDVEACWPHENSCPEDEFCCHHQLLFDLINEALVQIYDASFTYYPRALSSFCRVPPMAVKFNVLDEVWCKVSKIMNLELGPDLTVEGIMARDIWSDDRWMNLQLESECVVLELEDMLFDEFLDEIICF